jgi:hypothetical protein
MRSVLNWSTALIVTTAIHRVDSPLQRARRLMANDSQVEAPSRTARFHKNKTAAVLGPLLRCLVAKILQGALDYDNIITVLLIETSFLHRKQYARSPSTWAPSLPSSTLPKLCFLETYASTGSTIHVKDLGFSDVGYLYQLCI